MTMLAFVLAVAAIFSHAPQGVADRSATTAAVCVPGYARAHRRVPYAVRDRVYVAYGLPRGSHRGYVIDHLIPLELGGTTAFGNLWPQSRAAARRKDRDEDRLHDDVCTGRLSLAAARAEILRLWRR